MTRKMDVMETGLPPGGPHTCRGPRDRRTDADSDDGDDDRNDRVNVCVCVHRYAVYIHVYTCSRCFFEIRFPAKTGSGTPKKPHTHTAAAVAKIHFFFLPAKNIKSVFFIL